MAQARQPKRLAVLAYLAVVSVDGFRRRDPLVALFWPELDQATGRTYLRKAIHGIRDTLGAELFISRGEDELRVDPHQLCCDVVQLRQALADGRWSEALGHYRGELLEGMFPDGVAQEFHEWLSGQRRTLREAAALAAWACSEAEEARGDRTAAAVMARRARDLDPDNEEGVRRLMELLDRRGDRGSALRVFADWQARLMEEFGVEPAPETRRVARRIQAARKGESHETPPVMMPVGSLAPGARPPQLRAPSAAVIAEAPPATGRRPKLVRGALLVLGAFGLLAWWRSTATHPASVEVQALRAIGGAGADGLASAVTEFITTRLAADTALRVVSAGPASAGRSVSRVLTDGAIHWRGSRAVLTLRLIRNSDGTAVFAHEYPVDVAAADSMAQRLGAAAAADIRRELLRLRRE